MKNAYIVRFRARPNTNENVLPAYLQYMDVLPLPVLFDSYLYHTPTAATAQVEFYRKRFNWSPRLKRWLDSILMEFGSCDMM